MGEFLVDEVEIRREILRIIYDLNKVSQGYSVDSRDLLEKLDVTSNELFSNVKFLEGDGYLELEEFLGKEFKAKITPKGMEKVEKMGY
jgi:Mn-dependent DtxR family transcriptional regulator